MNLLRIFFSLLLIIVPMSVGVSASGYERNSGMLGVSLGLRASLSAEPRQSAFLDLLKRYEFMVPFEGLLASMTRVNVVETPTDGGIREDVPAEYKARFEKWKAEFLSTEYGRQQWDTYATNRKFILTIRVAANRGKGAGTDKFLWDDAGNFVGATITLGPDLDEGYPPPIYYPVLNSLSSKSLPVSLSGRLLAATKLSHEIGHVNQAAKANMKVLQLQNRLMPVYVSIFLKNGLDTKDKRLVDLALQMGGTPIEIWESREYWSEVEAMLFLDNRIGNEDFYCDVFNKIRWNLNEYAREYEQRFGQYSKSALVCQK